MQGTQHATSCLICFPLVTSSLERHSKTQQLSGSASAQKRLQHRVHPITPTCHTECHPSSDREAASCLSHRRCPSSTRQGDLNLLRHLSPYHSSTFWLFWTRARDVETLKQVIILHPPHTHTHSPFPVPSSTFLRQCQHLHYQSRVMSRALGPMQSGKFPDRF